MKWIRFICLISLMHLVDSMFAVGNSNKNKRESLGGVISFPSKRQRVDETMEASQIRNVLDENEQRKEIEQGTSDYSEEVTPRENPNLVIDMTTDKSENVYKIASDVAHGKATKQSIEKLLEERKYTIEKYNNPSSAYSLIEAYMESVFGKTDAQIESGETDYATSLLDWFSDPINVQKLELKRYDLTCGFLRALLRILGFSEIHASGRYEGSVIIRYRKKYKSGDKKTSNSRNTRDSILKRQELLRELIPHVNTVHIPSCRLPALLAEKGLDKTKIYAVLIAWLREAKVDRFIYSSDVKHKNKIYSCVVHHNLSKEQKDDIIVVNVWRILHIDANYKEKLPENYFPFVESKASNFKIIVKSCIALDPSFIDNLVGNTPASKCEIIFMNRADFYNFYDDSKKYDNLKNFEYSVKLNNGNLVRDNLQVCNNLYSIRYVFWDLNTKVKKIDISSLNYLRTLIETGKLKGLKRFTIVFPSQDSKLETAAAFFEVFGNNNGGISADSHKALQNTLKKYIELKTVEELEFLTRNLQQLFITFDTVVNSGFDSPKKLEVHFIYEDATRNEKNILAINNFSISCAEMALISKMKLDKLNLMNVIFRWNIRDKECLDVMEPDKENRWHGKIYAENSRYTMTEKEHEEINNERNGLLYRIHTKYGYRKRILKGKSAESSFSVSWLNEAESKLTLERNNEILETCERHKILWENISVEWIINGLEYFSKKNNLTTTTPDHVNIPVSDDRYALFTYLGLY